MLRAVVDSLDDVPQELHGEYVEKDGKFYLDLDDSIRAHTAVAPLASTVSALRASERGLKAQLQSATSRLTGLPDDFTPAGYQELTEELERLRTDPANRERVEQLQSLKSQYEERIRRLEARNNDEHRRQVEDLTTRAQRLETSLNTKLVQDGLTSALAEVGVRREFLPAVRAMLQSTVRVVEDEESGERRAVVETDLGEVDVRASVEAWAKSEAGKPFLVPAQGGGAGGGGSPRAPLSSNPFTHEGWNVTEQGRLVREKGEAHAANMARAAGTVLGGSRPASRRVAA